MVSLKLVDDENNNLFDKKVERSNLKRIVAN